MAQRVFSELVAALAAVDGNSQWGATLRALEEYKRVGHADFPTHLRRVWTRALAEGRQDLEGELLALNSGFFPAPDEEAEEEQPQQPKRGRPAVTGEDGWIAANAPPSPPAKRARTSDNDDDDDDGDHPTETARNHPPPIKPFAMWVLARFVCSECKEEFFCTEQAGAHNQEEHAGKAQIYEASTA